MGFRVSRLQASDAPRFHEFYLSEKQTLKYVRVMTKAMVRVALAVKASARTAEREPTAVLELGAAGDWSVKNSRARRVPPPAGAVSTVHDRAASDVPPCFRSRTLTIQVCDLQSPRLEGQTPTVSGRVLNLCLEQVCCAAATRLPAAPTRKEHLEHR